MCYDGIMKTEITQRELRNASGDIMRALDRGETFVVTRNGTPVGELRPVLRRQFVRAALVRAAFAGAAPIDSGRFRREVDAVLDQDPAPRA
jgi:antitoxin (DNA-binding transcriptional repressor) of toxin-antitoxin stability system